MPLTVLSDADIHSLLLTLTRDDIAELQYVFSQPMFSCLDQLLNSKTNYGDAVCSRHVPEHNFSLHIGNADSEIVIQAQSRRSPP